MIEEDAVTPVFDEKVIAGRIAELGSLIRQDAGSSEILLIGILKGTAVFLSDLMRSIEGRVRYHFVDVIRDQSDTEIAEAMQIDFMTHFEMKGQNIYLLKDVVTTGVIESYLLGQFRQRKPAALKLVALLDRPALRTEPVEVDYKAFEVEGGTFVGYGLEHGGRYGNLRFLGRL